MVESNGPKMLPCGIPVSNGSASKNGELMLTAWFFSEKPDFVVNPVKCCGSCDRSPCSGPKEQPQFVFFFWWPIALRIAQALGINEVSVEYHFFSSVLSIKAC